MVALASAFGAIHRRFRLEEMLQISLFVKMLFKHIILNFQSNYTNQQRLDLCILSSVMMWVRLIQKPVDKVANSIIFLALSTLAQTLIIPLFRFWLR